MRTADGTFQASRGSLSTLLAVLLLMTAGSGEAAIDSAPGIWTGVWDGFVSLLRFLIAPLLDVSIFDRGSEESSFYMIGYFLGVVAFAVAAGAAASADRDGTIALATTDVAPEQAQRLATDSRTDTPVTAGPR